MSKEQSGTRQSRVKSRVDVPDASHSYVSNATFGNLFKDVAVDGSRRNMSKKNSGTRLSRVLMRMLVASLCMYAVVIGMNENVGFTQHNTQGVKVTKTHRTTNSSVGVSETPGVGEGVHAVAKTNEPRIEQLKRQDTPAEKDTSITASVTTTDMTTHPLARQNASQVITWKGINDMNSFVRRFFSRGNELCDIMEKRKKTQNKNHEQPTLLNITFGCQEVFAQAGTGNVITAFYGARLAASVLGNVNVQMTCPDAVKEQTSLILPWLMGSFPVRGGASHVVSDPRDVVMTSSGGIRGSGSESERGSHISKNSTSTISSTVRMPTIKEACGSVNECPAGHMLPDMRYELRRMAVALVGVPHENHPAAAFAERYLWNPKDSNNDNHLAFSDNTMQLSVPARGEPPLIPGVVLDDVVLHFRGGDLLDSSHSGYGFMKFSAFSKRIPPTTKSIGIITQPFDNGAQQRKRDAKSITQKRHRAVVMALVDFLQEKFPQARVTIHNGSTETIALAFARMIMANQTIVGITSFAVFAAAACFGTGYIRKPINKGPNQWLMNPPIDQLADNVVLIDEPNLLMVKTARDIFKLPTGQDLVLEWFKNDDYCSGLASVACFLPSNSTV
jgi:hypothetical protein